MAHKEIEAKIVFLRLEAKDGKAFEFEIDPNKNVDAVFTSMDVIEKILIPFYTREDPKQVEELRRKIADQLKQSGIVIVPHMASCRSLVPTIHQGPSPTRC